MKWCRVGHRLLLAVLITVMFLTMGEMIVPGSILKSERYVYFGSYPQTELIGNELTSEITEASYDENGDAWVKGTKYRRISKSDTNDEDYFGARNYRYFKWERIKWRVLKNDGLSLFVVADRGLDCKNYNEDRQSVTWQECTLRQWLNDTFYETAFSMGEQKDILAKTVVNKDSMLYGTNGGYDTKDKVFLLSIDEAKNYKYNFCMGAENTNDPVEPSDYAHIMGANPYKGWRNDDCWWWLRSPGDSTFAAAIVGDGVHQDGRYVDYRDYAVVPAMHINLYSRLWYTEDDGTGGQGGAKNPRVEISSLLDINSGKFKSKEDLTDDRESEESQSSTLEEEEKTETTVRKAQPQNPIHHCTKKDDGTDVTEWDYVYFGSYPQTRIFGDALVSEITEAPYDENGDTWIDGTRYRRISKSAYFMRETNIEHYYFKWEPIRWRVLQNNGSTLFVVADQGLDSLTYNGLLNSNWESCTLRQWLNDFFYENAFSSEEQKAIVPQTIETELSSIYGNDGESDTRDRIFILSAEEVKNSEYGFCEDGDTYSASRQLRASDYAHILGAYTDSNSSLGENANGDWFLRTPSGVGGIMAVDSKGCCIQSGIFVDHNAIVPALHIDITSELWDTANPVPQSTVENAETDRTEWNYVYFGSYPQTEITGEALIPAIIEASYDENGDAWVDGVRYRRIGTSDLNYDTFRDNEYHYFKWEKIRWQVLQDDGSTRFLMADQGIDCRDYDERDRIFITWEECRLRQWLNDYFFKSAFNEEEQNAIAEQTVVNDDNPYYGTEAGKDTRDKVCLLSIEEAKNPEYGFCEKGSVYSASRQVGVSDYAYAKGAYVYGGHIQGGDANCYWWLRSPGSLRIPGIGSAFTAGIGIHGSVDWGGSFSSYKRNAVVPVLHVPSSYNFNYIEERENAAAIVEEVIVGTWGNGEERRERLTAAGYDYREIQDKVNIMLK